MSFTIFLIWSSLQPSCLVEQNHLCNFDRGHHGEHSCEVISNADQWFRRRCSYLELWQPFHQQTVIWVEGLIRNNSMKSERNPIENDSVSD